MTGHGDGHEGFTRKRDLHVVQTRAKRVQPHFSCSSIATSPTNSPANAVRWKRIVTRRSDRKYSWVFVVAVVVVVGGDCCGWGHNRHKIMEPNDENRGSKIVPFLLFCVPFLLFSLLFVVNPAGNTRGSGEGARTTLRGGTTCRIFHTELAGRWKRPDFGLGTQGISFLGWYSYRHASRLLP